MKGLFAALLVFTALSGAVAQPPTLHLPPLDRSLPPRAERIYAAMAPQVDIRAAAETVKFMSEFWRLAGNPGYDRSIDFVRDRLTLGGFASTTAGGPSVRVETFDHTGQGWEQERGTLAIDASPREILLSREQDRLALCINSFSTPQGGLVLRVVDVGAGTTPRDYEGKDVTGALVLGTGAVAPLWTRAVRERGAAGVVSSDLPRYTRPEETPNVLQWGSIPYDEGLHSFAFKATPRAARRLRDALATADIRVHVDIATRFHRGPNRTLIAEIPGAGSHARLPRVGPGAGAARRDERVVLVAHVQEPGASDNASGSGTLLSAALAIADAVARGRVPRPSRTLTFMWLDEIRGSERWIKDHPEQAASVVAMMSLDMTGEDTAKTGGTFLIEKSPDPSAVWPRPSDPHSEWGASEVARELVRGHFLNDLHLAVCLRRARDSGWVVRTNPYEGGSDHTVFTRAGVPALLNWHFTDRYYHTNLDTPDKTSTETMRNVAAAVSTTALFLASADTSDEGPLITLMNAAERARTQTEQLNAAPAEILDAWKTWYAEARSAVRRYVRTTP